MKKIITIVAIVTSTIAFSQVGIGTTAPSANSILDLTATDKGFLLPRVTTLQRNAIVPNNTTDRGMQVYDIDTASFWFWNGAAWVQQGAKNIYDSNGDIAPTATTNRIVDFTNGGSLNFDSNTLFLDATNNRVGIGTNAPATALDVNGTVRSVQSNEIFRYSTSAAGPAFISFYKSASNTIGENVALTGGQLISELRFSGFNGTTYPTRPAAMRVFATESFTSTANGTRIELGTTANATTGYVARMIIDQNGFFNFGHIILFWVSSV